MKKNRSNSKISVVTRDNTARNLHDNEFHSDNFPASDLPNGDSLTQSTDLKTKTESNDKPLIELLALTSEFFVFSYSPSLKSLITWSDNAKSILGVDEGRIARDGNLFLRHVHLDDRYQLQNDLESALEGKTAFRATYRWIRPDRNEQRWLHCRAVLNKSNATEIFEGIILDISDELAGPLKYFSGSESLHSVLSALPGIVVILDTDLRITRLSQPSESKDFGFGDFSFKHDFFKVGQSFMSCFSDSQLVSQIQNITNSIFSNQTKGGSFRVFEKGRSYKVDFFTQNASQMPATLHEDHLDGLVCVVSDVTELVHLESRVADLQRAESLRLLSAGIGHHFNNALQTIIGQATIINSHASNTELVRSASDSIVNCSLKAAELTRQLFSNIEKNSNTLHPLDPNLALTDALNKVDDLLKSGFEVAVVLGQLPLVKSNYEAIRAVFEAILKNARDAMRGKFVDKHHLSIKTYATELKDHQISHLNAGIYAVICITDSGVGMDAQTLSHCLDPFYTTKEPDPLTGINLHGAGLGLSQSFSIIRSYGGSIRVDSQKPLGSCVEIYLPADLSQLSDSDNKISNSAVLDENFVFPRVLLIDDDQLVSSTVQAMLKELNEECLVADNYGMALSYMKRFENSIELVLLDAILPASDSSIILKRLKQLKASLKIIGFSGATEEHTQALLNAGALEILEKPVQVSTLKELIKRHIGPLKAGARRPSAHS